MGAKKYVIISLILVLFLFGLSPGFVNAFAGGNGSVENPYQITNCIELQSINDGFVGEVYSRYNFNHYVLLNDIDCSETINWPYYEMGKKGFKPLGHYGGTFYGSLDGRNFTIYNLYSFASVASNYHYGFISSLKGILANINLINATFIFEGGIGVGGLAGYSNGGIYSCSFEGSVKGSEEVGGLVGRNYGNVSNSYAIAKVVRTDIYADNAVGLTFEGNIFESACYSGPGYPSSCCGFSSSDCVKITDISRFDLPFCSSFGGDVCETYESCSSDTYFNAMQSRCCDGDCSLQSCSALNGQICQGNQYCYSLDPSLDGACCTSGCIQKTCSQMSGDICASDEVCPYPGTNLNASDGNCCSTTCIKEKDLQCNSCSSCGDGFFNICDKDECEKSCALSEEYGCVFTPFSLGSGLIGGNCLSTPIVPITHCGVLNKSDVIYQLQNDIHLSPDMPEFANETGGYCFYILGDNVILDLNGHQIRGKFNLNEDYNGILCDNPSDPSSCSEHILPSGIYSQMNFLPFYKHFDGRPLQRDMSEIFVGGVAALGSNLYIKGGFINSFMPLDVYYVFSGDNNNIKNSIEEVFLGGMIYVESSSNNSAKLKIKNSYIMPDSADIEQTYSVQGILAYSDSVPIDLALQNVEFGGVYPSLYLQNSNLIVMDNFFRGLSSLWEFYFSGGNISVVSDIENPYRKFTLINPSLYLSKYENPNKLAKLNNSITFSDDSFNVDFVNFPELNVPAEITNKRISSNIRNLKFKLFYDALDGDRFVLPNSIAFLSDPILDPYLSMVVSGFYFCRSDSNCLNGSRCDTLSYRCI